MKTPRGGRSRSVALVEFNRYRGKPVTNRVECLTTVIQGRLETTGKHCGNLAGGPNDFYLFTHRGNERGDVGVKGNAHEEKRNPTKYIIQSGERHGWNSLGRTL